MVKVIMGVKGSGKTKRLIELIQTAVKEEHGSLVCIERKPQLTYDIPHTVRLVTASDYGISSYEVMKGFICGLHAGNYDITHIFIDNLFKILGVTFDERTEEFLAWCEEFSNHENVNFTMTVSADISLASDFIKKFF
ncbi:MAG: hypothetical protein IK136_01200 [Oscillospiraceae bacterium]|nr:hypothetical protein [Oscillospiraceae bacterium]